MDSSSGGVRMDLQLHPLSRLYLSGGDGVAAGLEGDQAVFPDPPQILLRHQIRLLRQRCQGGSIRLGADRDDLAVGAVNLTAADRQPTGEGAVELSDRVEAAPSQHMVTHDIDLPFDPTFPGWPIRCQDVDREAVMANAAASGCSGTATPVPHGAGSQS